jgi:hypothetical protein
MFGEPAKGHYCVKPEAPALKLGFENSDLSNVGLLSDSPKQWREGEKTVE